VFSNSVEQHAAGLAARMWYGGRACGRRPGPARTR
jgi:hypothetical protein